MADRKTIVLVLRSGGDFHFRDVELIARHINGKWQSPERPRIICLWDKAREPYDLGNMELIPLGNDYPGTWARMALYSPAMEQYRPFLYVDLDTAIIKSLENIFRLIPDPSLFITLEDFWQKGELATGMAWIPAKSEVISRIWEAWVKNPQGGMRMDKFLRKVVPMNLFFQQFTTTIYDFKPRSGQFLNPIPEDANVVCFHGKPRIFQIANASMSLGWVQTYVNARFDKAGATKRVTVIIPYKQDRGWLKEAINSVPQDVQLIISQGEGNWPSNFNKVLHLAEGEFIKFLHEDDMLTENCIADSVRAIEEQNVDFIHGNAIELSVRTGKETLYIPSVTIPTMGSLMRKNVIHCATLMYRREVFERLGGFNEELNSQEEYEFNLRCLDAHFKIGYCDSILAVYRRHPNQKVRILTAEEKRKEKELVNQMYLG